MRLRSICLAVGGWLLLMGGSAMAAVDTPSLAIYPGPVGATASNQYSMQVLVDGMWEDAFVYFDPQRTFGGGTGNEPGKTFSWCTFEAAGPVTVRVRRLEGAFNTVALRPTRYGITGAKIGADTVEFSIQPGQKVSVEFDTEIKANGYSSSNGIPIVKDAMMVFADPRKVNTAISGVAAADLYTVTPGSHEEILTVTGGTGLTAGKSTLGDCGGKRVVVFGPGVYDIGYWQVPNNIDQIHLAGGALVYGAIDVLPQGRAPFYDTATIATVWKDAWFTETLRPFFKLTGGGVLSSAKLPWHVKKDFTYTANDEWWAHVKAVQFGVANVTVEDVTIASAPHWTLTWMNDADHRTTGTLSGFKMVGAWCYNNDGLPNPSGAGSSITNCFIHADDDAFKIYNSGSSIDNCVVWQSDNGAVFQFGWFPKTVNKVTVSNVDIIHCYLWYGNGQASRSIFSFADAGGSGTISGIAFNNIHVEGQILRLFGFNITSGTQAIRDFTFSNLHVPGGMGAGVLGAPGRNYFIGDITNFNFQSFRLGTDLMTSAAQAQFDFSSGAGAGFVFGTGGLPIVSAGSDVSITLPTNSAVLSGSSSDPGGAVVTNVWTQVSGPSTATLSGAPTVTLTASNLVAGTYVFRLTATDNEGNTNTDEASVTVLPAPVPQSILWDRGGGSDDVIVAANWAGDGVPGPLDSAVFKAAGVTSNIFSVGANAVTWGTVVVNSNQTAFWNISSAVASGEAMGTLTLTGQDYGQYSNAVIINPTSFGGGLRTNVNLDGGGTFAILHCATGGLEIDGKLRQTNGTASLLIDGGGTSNARVHFRGNNTAEPVYGLTGNITLRNGANLRIEDGYDIAAYGGTITIQSGSRLNIQPNVTYTVSALIANGASLPPGSYNATSLSSLGLGASFETASPGATVVVTGPPVAPFITSQPGAQTVALGATASLSVSASGTGPISYQWYGGNSGDTSSPVSGATSSTYVSGPLAAWARYWVRCSSGAGYADSNTALVRVTGGAVTLADWTAQNGVPSNLRGALDAPAADGIANLMKFAFGTHPMAAVDFSRLRGEVTGTTPLAWGFVFDHNPLAQGIQLALESSGNLSSWSEVASTWEVLNTNPNGTETVRLTESAPPSGESHRFLRLKVKLTP